MTLSLGCSVFGYDPTIPHLIRNYNKKRRPNLFAFDYGLASNDKGKYLTLKTAFEKNGHLDKEIFFLKVIIIIFGGIKGGKAKCAVKFDLYLSPR